MSSLKYEKEREEGQMREEKRKAGGRTGGLIDGCEGGGSVRRGMLTLFFLLVHVPLVVYNKHDLFVP